MAVMTGSHGDGTRSRAVSGSAAFAATMLLATLGCSSDPGDRSGTPTPSSDAATGGLPDSPQGPNADAGGPEPRLDSPLAIIRGVGSLEPTPAAPARLHIGEKCVTVRILGAPRVLVFTNRFVRWDADRGQILLETVGGGRKPPLRLRDGERVRVYYQANRGFTFSGEWFVPPHPSCPAGAAWAYDIKPA